MSDNPSQEQSLRTICPKPSERRRRGLVSTICEDQAYKTIRLKSLLLASLDPLWMVSMTPASLQSSSDASIRYV